MMPSEWHVNKVSRITPMTVGWTPPTGTDSSFIGDNLWANISDLGARVLEDTAKRISDEAVTESRIRRSPLGSLLYSFKLSVGQVSFAGADMYTNEAIATFLGSEQLDLGYAYYALPVYLIENASENIYGAKILNQERILSTRVALPSFPMQRVLADFLDHETAEIDAFIADQEELIGLLAERRAATISHAVTKGLHPNVPMKDSGVKWLGEVPEHWAVGQLKNVGELTLGKMLAPSESSQASIRLSYMRAANVQPLGNLDLTSVKEMWFTPDEARKLSLQRGDVVIVEGGVGGYGRAAFLTEDLMGWAFQNSIIRLRPFVKCDGRFATYVLLHLRQVGYIKMVASVASMPHFTLEKVESTEISWPERAEQAAISDYLDHETAEVDATIADAREAISLSRERRAALISAAVTGKIDVREHGAVA
jgi:type I restriction enzyme S subunit